MWPMDKILTGTATSDQIKPGGNGNKEVTAQSSEP